MRKFQFSILGLCLIFIGISCSEDNDDNINCNNTQIAHINEVDAPEMANSGETIQIDVTYSMKNTCGNFSRFIESSGEQGLVIAVEANYTGCRCGQAIITDIQVYEFTPQNSGIYQLNFQQSVDEFITVTIEVAE